MGIRFGTGGRRVCRFSGTEPLLRLFCETDREERAGAVIWRMKDFPGLDGRKAE